MVSDASKDIHIKWYDSESKCTNFAISDIQQMKILAFSHRREVRNMIYDIFISYQITIFRFGINWVLFRLGHACHTLFHVVLLIFGAFLFFFLIRIYSVLFFYLGLVVFMILDWWSILQKKKKMLTCLGQFCCGRDGI